MASVHQNIYIARISVDLGFEDDLEHSLQLSFSRGLHLRSGPHSDVNKFLITLMKTGNLCFEVLRILLERFAWNSKRRQMPWVLYIIIQSFDSLKKFVIRDSIAVAHRELFVTKS